MISEKGQKKVPLIWDYRKKLSGYPVHSSDLVVDLPMTRL